MNAETTAASQSTGLRKLFPNKEAIEYLHLSPVTLWRARKYGQIAFRRIGGKIFYTIDDLNDFIEQAKQVAG